MFSTTIDMISFSIRNRIIALLLVLSGLNTAVAQTPYRFEGEISAGTLKLPGAGQTGWSVRQQVTGYFRPRLGVSVGIGWGGVANTAPLNTANTPNVFTQPDPVGLNQFFVRSDRMVDFSVVVLPILTRRHQVSLRAGLSVYRSNATRVDSLIFLGPNVPTGGYQAVLGSTTTNRVAPMLGGSYDFRLSNRWAAGVQATAYFTGQNRPVTTFGLRTTYRFNLGADSLGFGPVNRSDLRVGVRLAANLSASNGGRATNTYQWRGVGGIWAELPLSLTWRMRGEINYAQRGQGYRGVDVNGVQYASGFTRLNYLEMPLLFRNEVAYHWNLYGGPYLAFMLNGRAENRGVPETVESHTFSGLMVGVDYQLSKRLGIDLRYQRDILFISTTTSFGGLHGFQAGLTYTFGKNLNQ